MMSVSMGLLALAPTGANADTSVKGTVPPASRVVVIQAHGQTGSTDTLKFKFFTPVVPGAVAHAVAFCIGPAPTPTSDPCLQAVLEVDVPNGEARLAVIPASVFANNVLAVRNVIGVAVPYTVTME
jgi:hypothetical protein